MGNIENILTYVGVGAIVAAVLVFVIYKVVKFCKMSKENKREVLLSYLIGLVTIAEEKIGSGQGEKKLAEVEEKFQKNAGFFYKLILKVLGKDNLKDLIGEALVMVKKNFGTATTAITTNDEDK